VIGYCCWITRHPFNFDGEILKYSFFSLLFTQGEHILHSRFAIRSKYWSQFINHDETVLAGLRWYINVVFDRAGVSYQGNDIKIKNLQEQHVMIESKRIFDLCYRDDRYSSFVVNDHQRCCDMNGRHGKIISYDSLRQQYNVSITSNDSKQTEGYITALPPSVMEPRCVFQKRKNYSCYPLSRHENCPSRTSEIQLKLPKPSSLEPISIRQDKEVKCLFFYDIFEFVRRVHVHPEQVANGTSKALLLT